MAKRRPARQKTAATRKKTRKKTRVTPGRVPSPSAVSPKEKADLEARMARRRDAIGTYQRGLEALQKRDFPSAAAAFRAVLEEFHDERDLHERSRTHLRVCDRQMTPAAAKPKTPEELVYAATVALNNAAQDESLRHLQQAIGQNPDDECAHYMLAVVHAQADRPDLAISHLERAVDLEPENRKLARQEPDFESLRETEQVQQLLKPPVAKRRRARRASR